jgi:hypothetical protein
MRNRKSASAIRVDTNVRCRRIYPVEDSKHAPRLRSDLKTVAIQLSKDQAIHLARVMLIAAQALARLQAQIGWVRTASPQRVQSLVILPDPSINARIAAVRLHLKP